MLSANQYAEIILWGEPSVVDNTWQRDGERRWWSKTIFTGALVAVALLPVGALGSRFGLWSFGMGFMLLAAGVMMSCVVLVTGIAGLVVARRQRLVLDKPPLWVSVALSTAVLALMGLQFYKAMTVPQIHNISTDVDDPPQFDRVIALRGADANPLHYDAAELADDQQRAYPWVRTLETELPPEQALERAVEVLEAQGLEIVNVDPTAGRVEAVDTTFWFGFKDDVVVRVRPASGGSRVDMRSVSRVGRSDLGTNAARIGEFLEAFRDG